MLLNSRLIITNMRQKELSNVSGCEAVFYNQAKALV